jgi:hypothetical protein
MTKKLIGLGWDYLLEICLFNEDKKENIVVWGIMWENIGI